jgi:hypothetical protein
MTSSVLDLFTTTTDTDRSEPSNTVFVLHVVGACILLVLSGMMLVVPSWLGGGLLGSVPAAIAAVFMVAAVVVSMVTQKAAVLIAAIAYVAGLATFMVVGQLTFGDGVSLGWVYLGITVVLLIVVGVQLLDRYLNATDRNFA